MRILSILLLLFMCAASHAQTTTIYLFRHAEKDTVSTTAVMMNNDVDLSAKGKKRAILLADMLKNVQADLFFSTNYKRTKQTLQPLAHQQGKSILIYNPKNQQAFADSLLSLKGKTIVVAGHSNTIPKLANLLIQQNKFSDWDEKVYHQYFIITVKDGTATAQMMEYPLLND